MISTRPETVASAGRVVFCVTQNSPPTCAPTTTLTTTAPHTASHTTSAHACLSHGAWQPSPRMAPAGSRCSGRGGSTGTGDTASNTPSRHTPLHGLRGVLSACHRAPGPKTAARHAHLHIRVTESTQTPAIPTITIALPHHRMICPTTHPVLQDIMTTPAILAAPRIHASALPRRFARQTKLRVLMQPATAQVGLRNEPTQHPRSTKVAKPAD